MDPELIVQMFEEYGRVNPGISCCRSVLMEMNYLIKHNKCDQIDEIIALSMKSKIRFCMKFALINSTYPKKDALKNRESLIEHVKSQIQFASKEDRDIAKIWSKEENNSYDMDDQ
jgi:hypothetical protein